LKFEVDFSTIVTLKIIQKCMYYQR